MPDEEVRAVCQRCGFPKPQRLLNCGGCKYSPRAGQDQAITVALSIDVLSLPFLFAFSKAIQVHGPVELNDEATEAIDRWWDEDEIEENRDRAMSFLLSSCSLEQQRFVVQCMRDLVKARTDRDAAVAGLKSRGLDLELCVGVGLVISAMISGLHFVLDNDHKPPLLASLITLWAVIGAVWIFSRHRR